MPRCSVAAIFTLATALTVSAQTGFFPMKDLKPGMHGIGKTVFSGDRIEDFQVEILGVLENIGPKQSLILARLSGGPLGETGVLQGMSGSPVYIGGKLVGAVAMAFPFAKEPIAGIRPVEDMIRGTQDSLGRTRQSRLTLADTDLTRLFPRREEAMAGSARMVDIATPVSFGGFTRSTIDQFIPQLQSLGLEPRQGVTAGGRMTSRMGNRALLKPGSMISVQLMTGDMSIGADGTVTYIQGNKLYAFGHRFLSVGSTALPFSRAKVITLLPVLSSSFKISTPQELMGTISQDRNTAVSGELGRQTEMVPISISVLREGRRLDGYHMQMVDDRLLSPLLVQMAVFSAIDATERTVGAASFRVKGQIEFENGVTPIRLNNMFAADNGSALQVSLSTAIPLAYVLQSDFDKLKIRKVEMEIESFDQKKQLTIDQVQVSKHEVYPGETVDLTVTLAGPSGAELTRTVPYRVPEGALPGLLYFTVADGATTNITELRQIIGSTPRSPAQLISTVNSLKGNTKAYVRVWRPAPAFQLAGTDLPDPPPSVSLILSGSQPTTGSITQTQNSKIAELEISAGDMVITGSKTIQVEVKE